MALDLDQLAEQVEDFRAKHPGAKIGITSGVFDLVHSGHTNFLREAKKSCDFLIVVLASDRTTKQLKGEERPWIAEKHRSDVMAAMRSVDATIISDELYHETILDRIKPDIMFKGGDYKGKKIIGAEKVGEVKIVEWDADPRGDVIEEVLSTTHITKQIQRAAKQPQMSNFPGWM